MKKFLILFVIICTLVQCRKSAFNDVSGPATLKGVAVTYDTLHGVTVKTVLKNAKIFIKYDNAPNGFLYAVTSNAQGQYVFSGIDTEKGYTVYSQTDTGIVKYYGKLDYAANQFTDGQSDSLKLYPDPTNQNGIHLIVQDNMLGRVPNVTAWVFNSPVLFLADSSAGRVFDMISNSYGVNNKFNVAPGIYYLRIKTRIGSLDLAAEASVVVPPTGIVTVTLTLQNGALNRNGMEITTLDLFNTPVSNAKVYCYRSYAVFLADTIQYNNSLFSMISTASGKASAYIIEPATYYLRAVKTVNTQTLKQTATVTVNSNTISTASMILQ